MWSTSRAQASAKLLKKLPELGCLNSSGRCVKFVLTGWYRIHIDDRMSTMSFVYGLCSQLYMLAMPLLCALAHFCNKQQHLIKTNQYHVPSPLAAHTAASHLIDVGTAHQCR